MQATRAPVQAKVCTETARNRAMFLFSFFNMAPRNTRWPMAGSKSLNGRWVC